VVLDNTRHLNRIPDVDAANLTARVKPGLMLDELNRALKPHGLWFPVDPSTASLCTIGGIAANTSSGGKSLRYGIMRDTVRSISAILPNGWQARFDRATPNPAPVPIERRTCAHWGSARPPRSS
jgi:FAD/FMN-containing dehydrogenase